MHLVTGTHITCDMHAYMPIASNFGKLQLHCVHARRCDPKHTVRQEVHAVHAVQPSMGTWSFSELREERMSFAPRFARYCASRSPMPWLPPVIHTTFPCMAYQTPGISIPVLRALCLLPSCCMRVLHPCVAQLSSPHTIHTHVCTVPMRHIHDSMQTYLPCISWSRSFAEQM